EVADIGARYTGATPGAADPTKPPVVIGWVNQQGAVPAFPESTAGVEAAVAYVNGELGGIDRHPIVLRQCHLGAAPADSTRCGELLGADPEVRFVQLGTMQAVNSAFYAALAGRKPVIGGNPVDAADYTAPNAYFFNAGLPGIVRGLARYATTTLGARTVGIV